MSFMDVMLTKDLCVQLCDYVGVICTAVLTSCVHRRLTCCKQYIQRLVWRKKCPDFTSYWHPSRLTNQIQLFAYIPTLRNLEYIHIENFDPLHMHQVRILCALSHLKGLNIEHLEMWTSKNTPLVINLPRKLQQFGLSNTVLVRVNDEDIEQYPTPNFIIRGYNEYQYRRLHDENLATIHLPPMLCALNLSSNNFTGQIFHKIFVQARNIRRLNLSFNNIHKIHFDVLARLDTLEELLLQGNCIGAQGLHHICKLRNLVRLDLSNNPFGAEFRGHQHHLHHSVHFPPKLKCLLCNRCSIDSDTLKRIRLPPTLETLGLSNNNIDKKGFQQLALPDTLRDLDLSFNLLGTDDYWSIQLPRVLQHLNVGHNASEQLRVLPTPHFRNMSLQRLKDPLRQRLPTSLQSLDLGNTYLSFRGLENMSTVLPDRLQILNLSDNKLQDYHVTSILYLPPTLRQIDFTLNNLSMWGIAKMIQTAGLPKALQRIYVHANPRIDETTEERLQSGARLWLLEYLQDLQSKNKRKHLPSIPCKHY